MSFHSSFTLQSEECKALGKRVAVQPLLLVTQRKKGNKWNTTQISVDLPDFEGKTAKLFIGEETSLPNGLSVCQSPLIWFSQNNGVIETTVRFNVATFGLPPVLRARAKQITKPRFVLVCVVENKVVALSQQFLARSRWGVEAKDTDEIIRRLEEIGRTVFNVGVIRDIDRVKSLWRSSPSKELQSKTEKASWLQFHLLDDHDERLSLTQRARKFFKTNKCKKELEIIGEIQNLIYSGSQQQTPLPSHSAGSSPQSSVSLVNSPVGSQTSSAPSSPSRPSSPYLLFPTKSEEKFLDELGVKSEDHSNLGFCSFETQQIAVQNQANRNSDEVDFESIADFLNSTNLDCLNSTNCDWYNSTDFGQEDLSFLLSTESSQQQQQPSLKKRKLDC